MDATRRKGLSGKARRARERNRVTRLHASQRLQEYYEPEAVGASAERYIPIRHRKVFCPSVEYTEPAGIGAAPVREAIVKPGTVVSRSPRKSRPARPMVKVHARADKALRLSCTTQASRDATLARAAIYGRRETFRWRGFLYGCAMGTAAASVLLICVAGAVG